MSKAEIDEIESQIGQLNAKLISARSRLSEARLKDVGLHVGQIVMQQSVPGREDRLVIITGWGNTSPQAFCIKKDGTVGFNSAGYVSEWRELTDEEQQALEGKK